MIIILRAKVGEVQNLPIRDLKKVQTCRPMLLLLDLGNLNQIKEKYTKGGIIIFRVAIFQDEDTFSTTIGKVMINIVGC